MLKQLSELDKLIEIIDHNFDGLSESIQLLLGAVSTLALKEGGKTLPLILLGPSSVGKSTSLEIIGRGLGDRACFVDNFSPKSFRSAKDSAEGDLLDYLPDKVLVTTELNVLFRKPASQLSEFFGVVTKVADSTNVRYAHAGHVSGSHDDFNFIWIGAGISIPKHISDLFSISLGPRLYFVNLQAKDETLQEVEAKLLKMVKSRDYWPKVSICARALAAFLQSIDFQVNSIVWDKCKDEGLEIISRAAIVLRVLRAGLPVEKTSGKGLVYEPPIYESEERAMAVLYLLGQGLAILERANFIRQKDLSLVVKIAIDTASASYPPRALIFRQLLKRNGLMTLEQFIAASKYSKNFAREELKKMEILGMVKVYDNKIKFSQKYEKISLDLRPYVKGCNQ